MGVVIQPELKIEANQQIASMANFSQQKKAVKDYDIEVIEVSNIAMAIKNKQHTINVQLSLRCEGLPTFKAFGSTDSMIVVLKSDDSSQGSVQNFVEIGRTQIVSNNLNPIYIKTFIFPFKGQTTEQLQFRIYHMVYPKIDDLKQQKLIGKVNTNLHGLVDNEQVYEEIKQTSKSNSKAMLTISCSEYDGGNSYYEVAIQLSNFITKSQIYFIIQVRRSSQFIPIAKSQTKRASKFKEIKISINNKFQGEENTGVRIKVFEADKEEQIGRTQQFAIIDIANQEKSQSHRVLHGGFVVGTAIIHKWKKAIRDSFISYIVGGARLHLLLAIDFTNSNSQNGQSLHTLDGNGGNVYINAIRQIVGVLQYFSVQNQVALYGFGAKLPPFYKSVSQCFALNGNYFYPNVQGGVDEIVRLYKQNLQKIKMHGPTKISQILDLAIKYASQEQIMSTKASTYYVLLIITDGKINDYQDTVDLIVKASTLPLSILFVGVGDGDEENEKNMFQTLQYLDTETLSLKSSKTGKICERDIVDFIRMSDFVNDHNGLTLARETFAEIPNQFIEYMSSKNIKPLKQKKNLKAAKAEFIAQKIKSNPEKAKQFITSFLEKEERQMIKKLTSLGFNPNDSMIAKMNIAMNDLSYFIEVHSQNKKAQIEENKQRVEYVNVKEVKKLQQYLDRKDQNKKIKTLQKLQKIQGNQYGRKVKQVKKVQQKIVKQTKMLDHPCLRCKNQQINMVHMECGHSSVCSKCFNPRCIICYHINRYYKKFKYNSKGDIECSDSD